MFQARVIQVLIASPNDVRGARRLVREAVEDWNALHAEDSRVVLLPLMWERDATPEMGRPAQEAVSRQLGDRADAVVAVLWTRLGTPTEEGRSGTADEIQAGIDAEKPVLVYFSEEPVVPASVDTDEYDRLREYRAVLEGQGLLDTYSTPEELRQKVTAALTRTVRERFQAEVTEAYVAQGQVHLLARIDTERELHGFSRGGSPRYRSRYALVIENRGTVPAENLSIVLESEGAEENALPAIIDEDRPIHRLAPGGEVRFPLIVHMGTVGQCEVRMAWAEGEESREDMQTVRIY